MIDWERVVLRVCVVSGAIVTLLLERAQIITALVMRFRLLLRAQWKETDSFKPPPSV